MGSFMRYNHNVEQNGTFTSDQAEGNVHCTQEVQDVIDNCREILKELSEID